MSTSTFFQRALLITLSFQMALTPTLAYAHNSQEPGLPEIEASEFSALIESSAKIPAGQPRGSFAPDRFLLLEQEAHVVNRMGRAFGVFSNAAERDLNKHFERLDQAREIENKVRGLLAGAKIEKPCAPFMNDARMNPVTVLTNIVNHLNSDYPKSTPNFVWESRQNPTELACLEERVSDVVGDWNRRVYDLWETRANLDDVPNVTQAPAREAKRFYNWWNLTVKVKSKSGDEQLADLRTKNTADKHSIDDANAYNCNNGDSCQFDLNAGSRVLNSFHVPVRAITTFGPYVVFVHNDSFDKETGTQYLSFVDLATYGASIGHAVIPIFRLPLPTGEEVTSLSVRNKMLVLNGKSQVIVEGFMAASALQQMAFNITNNVTEPNDIAAIMPYIDGLQTTFQKVVADALQDARQGDAGVGQIQISLTDLGTNLRDQILSDKALNQFANGKKASLDPDEVENLSQQMKVSLEKYTEGLLKTQTLRTRMDQNAKRMTYSRSLNGKLEQFFKRIMVPSPNASLKIQRALVLVGAYRSMNQGKAWQFAVDRPWLHPTLLAAGMLLAVSPDTFVHVAEAGLALGNGIFDYSKFALFGLSEAILKGSYATFGPLVDGGSAFMKQYVSDGNWSKTLIGLSVFIPTILSCYYVPHLIFNLHHMLVDYRKPTWKGFVDHQRQFVREYYERLADDEAKRRQVGILKAEGTDAPMFSAEEEREIQEFIAGRELENKNRRDGSVIRRFLRVFKRQNADLQNASANSSAVQAGADRTKIKGIWSALASVTFSYPAMELTLGHWARFWNWFSGSRYSMIGFLTLRDVGLKYNFPVFIRPKPVTSAVRILYPDFFTTVVAKRGPELTIPTALNGGTRMWGVRDMVWLKEVLFGKPSQMREAEDDLAREMTLAEVKGMTEEFENEILSVEDAVHKEAFESALRRLPDFVSDKKTLLKLFTEKPLSSVVEKRVRELPSEVRTFLRLYFEEVYGATMSEYMKSILQREDATWNAEVDGAGLSLVALKQKLIEVRRENRERKSYGLNRADALMIARRFTADNTLFDRVSTQARKGELSIHNFIMNRKFNVLGDMDPKQNPSMKRYAVVQERLASPNALSRAVRAEISKLLVTFPLNLAFKLVLSAGIFEGAFKPIQDEMLGPNSIYYFSRDTFYMTMCAGFVIGMMADAWVKLQMDARQDEMGDFGAIPKGEDAERGIWHWFIKQFNAKNNSVLGNWHNSNSIAFWNFPAALANMGLFYYLFSGRLDLSFILAGYAMAFGTPLSAFYYKLDQAFERAVEYAARGVKDEKWMAHPDIQQLISKDKQRYRNRFQYLLDTYLNVQGNWQNAVEVIPTSYGPRGFARALFGGSLLEETIVEKLLHPAKELVKNVPVVNSVVEQIANGCEYLLTNGNVDLRLKK